MTEAGSFKVEVAFIQNLEDWGAGNKAKDKTYAQYNPPADHMTSVPVNTQAKSLSFNLVEAPASMATAVDKHQDGSAQKCRNISEASEVRSGLSLNRLPESDDRLSPTDSTELFPTLASSRESILSDGWDRERSWSGMLRSMEASPLCFSRAMSPCSTLSSSCVFSPSVVRVTRHSLAPGSSLVHMAPTSFPQACGSMSSGVMSPRPRHRPPPTRLSLLTAILRKGRLPVLSSAVHRPYSPCWPVNSVSLSSCAACSAASSLASIPLAVSSTESHQIRSLQTGCVLGSVTCKASPQSSHLRERSDQHIPSLRQSERQESNNGPGGGKAPFGDSGVPAPYQSLCQNLSGVMKSSSGLKAPQWPFYQSNYNLPSPREPEENVETRKPHVSSPYSFSSGSGLCSQTPNVKPIKGKPTPFKACAYSSLHSVWENRDFQKAVGKHRDLGSPAPSPRPTSSLSRVSSLSSELSTLSCLALGGELSAVYSPGPTGSNSHEPTVGIMSGQNDAKDVPQQGKGLQSSLEDRLRVRHHCLFPSRYTPITFPEWPSPLQHSRSSTPDRLTLCPSPTTQPCDLTSPWPLSLRSTPSPRPGSGMSDSSDRAGKKRQPHKIKLSYKALAAIPTNTLLLDQQATDDPIVSTALPEDTLDKNAPKDTHAEMCSPAQLRQQSEELYAVIDEVLEASNPIRQPSPANTAPRNLIDKNEPQHYPSIPRFLGRETKYASYSVQPPAWFERKLLDPYQTKPGVIRPVSVSPRLTRGDDDNTNYPNPFRQYLEDQVSDNRKVLSKVAGISNLKSTRPIVTIKENEALVSNKHGKQTLSQLVQGLSSFSATEHI